MLIMSFMNSEKEALDLPAIVTGNGEAYPYKKKFINGVTAGKKYPGY